MVSQADIARATKDKTAGEVVEAISRPSRAPRVAGGDASEAERGASDTQPEHTRNVRADDDNQR
jgi:hypothetical protein